MKEVTSILIMVLFIFINSIFVTGYTNLDYSNPQDEWLDLVISLNQSGNNFSADNFIQNGTFIDDIYVNVAGDTMTGDLDINGSGISFGVEVTNNLGFSTTTLDLIHTNGGRSSFVRLGPDVPEGTPGSGGNSTGIVNFNGTLYLATSNNETIYFGSFPDSNTQAIDFDIAIDPSLEALVFQGNKYIRPVMIDGGDALVFQSLDILPAGGFPFIWVAQDSDNNTIVPRWIQNGANNSFSGTMNSFGTVPKSWVNFTGDPLGDDLQGLEFLFNRSNYVKYCDYLNDTLGLVDTGCRYFADTSGRLVPLLFGGDLEIHRTAFIHEGLIVRESFDVIDLAGEDANFVGGPIHPRFAEIVLVGFDFGVDLDTLNEDFELGNLGGFDGTWLAVPDIGDCPEITIGSAGDFCAEEIGTALNSEIQADFSTENINVIALTFDINADLDGPGSNDGTLSVYMNNNSGSGDLLVYQILATDVLDTRVINDTLGTSFNNISTVSLIYDYTGTDFNQINLDNVIINGTTIANTLRNVSVLRTEIKLLDGSPSCQIKAYEGPNGDPDQLNITCDLINLIGNVTQTSVTVVSQNVTGDVTAVSFTLDGETMINWDNITTYAPIYTKDEVYNKTFSDFRYWNEDGDAGLSGLYTGTYNLNTSGNFTLQDIIMVGNELNIRNSSGYPVMIINGSTSEIGLKVTPDGSIVSVCEQGPNGYAIWAGGAGVGVRGNGSSFGGQFTSEGLAGAQISTTNAISALDVRALGTSIGILLRGGDSALDIDTNVVGANAIETEDGDITLAFGTFLIDEDNQLITLAGNGVTASSPFDFTNTVDSVQTYKVNGNTINESGALGNIFYLDTENSIIADQEMNNYNFTNVNTIFAHGFQDIKEDTFHTDGISKGLRLPTDLGTGEHAYGFSYQSPSFIFGLPFNFVDFTNGYISMSYETVAGAKVDTFKSWVFNAARAGDLEYGNESNKVFFDRSEAEWTLTEDDIVQIKMDDGYINITGTPDGDFNCYIYTSNGGCMLGGNSTCNFLFSPDGTTTQEVCN